jgi:SAM-dependent methyltransferase
LSVVLAALEYAPHATTLLDVGCGAGDVLEAARRLGLSAAGCDPSRAVVDACRQKGYRVELADLTALPFPDGAFDLVVARHALQHAPRPSEALAELRRVLGEGGVLVLVVPDGDSRWGVTRAPVSYSDATLALACQRARLTPVLEGQAVFRRRLAVGWRKPLEVVRALAWVLWTTAARALRLRRELQILARRDSRS